MKTIALYNGEGGVEKTTLSYHLAHMFCEMGYSTLVADLDPQANISSMFLTEERLEEVWSKDTHHHTISGTLSPIIEGIGDIADPEIEVIKDGLGLLIGDLELALFEAKLSEAWPACLSSDPAAFRVTSAFFRIIQKAALKLEAEYVIIDVGPNLGAITRSALLAADDVIVPLAADLFSLQGLRNLGPTRKRWRTEWQDRLERSPKNLQKILPAGKMNPIGYVVLQHAIRLDRPTRAYRKWLERIPSVYATEVAFTSAEEGTSTENDPNCLATIKNYRSLMPLAQDARKPVFELKPADGAIGAHMQAVRDCYHDFQNLVEKIINRINLPV